jgi:hypothetical protein
MTKYQVTYYHRLICAVTCWSSLVAGYPSVELLQLLNVICAPFGWSPHQQVAGTTTFRRIDWNKIYSHSGAQAKNVEHVIIRILTRTSNIIPIHHQYTTNCRTDFGCLPSRGGFHLGDSKDHLHWLMHARPFKAQINLPIYNCHPQLRFCNYSKHFNMHIFKWTKYRYWFYYISLSFYK